jgi:hypothetical protein
MVVAGAFPERKYGINGGLNRGGRQNVQVIDNNL